MQLDTPKNAALRLRLGAAAGALLAWGLPAMAQAPHDPAWQVDAAALLYGEGGRTQVIEPFVRVTRLFTGGQSLSARLGLDTMTGATPSGAVPSGQVQTTTSASGRSISQPAGQIPLSNFKDTRGSLDLGLVEPLAPWFTTTWGAHFSREKDYQSQGINGKLSVDFMQRLATLTVGGGTNHDKVFPVGGTPPGLTDGRTGLDMSSQAKRVTDGLVGLSRVITRRWMMAINYSRTFERGFLTEPYKVLSVVNPRTGIPVSALTENRPSSRNRSDVMLSSVYHLTDDVLYLSHRAYWDDWGVKSNTVDVKYRHELEDNRWLQPHVRYYWQTPADFFTYGLVQGTPLPRYATSDGRLGRLRTLTLGATYGFRIEGYPGEWSIRGELIRQSGDGHPGDAVGIQRDFDLYPKVNTGTFMLAYSVEF